MPADPDDELAALEAAEARARRDARRAAAAVQRARRAREAAAGGARAADPSDDDAAAGSATSLSKSPSTSSSTATGSGASGSGASGSAKGASGKGASAGRGATKPGSPSRRPAASSPARAEAAKARAAAAAREQRRPRRRPGRVAIVLTALTVAAAVFLGVSIVLYVKAGDNASTSPARARDQALLAARQDLVVLNSLDYRNVDQGLAAWADVTVGDLHERLSNVDDTSKQAITDAKSTTTAKVLAAGVSQVDARAGNATVLVSVQVDVTPATGNPSVKRERFEVAMTRVGATWKVNTLKQIGLTLQ